MLCLLAGQLAAESTLLKPNHKFMAHLILPGDPEFDFCLGAILPPNWKQAPTVESGGHAFVARAGSGILQPVTEQELDDYLYGGEYEERLQELGDDELLNEFRGECG